MARRLRDYRTEYRQRTAIAKIQRLMREHGVTFEQLAEHASDAGQTAIELGLDEIDAARRQARRWGRRIDTLLRKVTKSQLRGHPRHSEPLLSTARRRASASSEAKYREAVHLIAHANKSLTSALSDTGLSRPAFKRLNEDYKAITLGESLPGRRKYQVNPKRAVNVTFLDRRGRERSALLVGRELERWFQYRDDARRAIERNDPSHLKRWRSATITSADGTAYTLSTDLAVLKQSAKTVEPRMPEHEGQDSGRLYYLAA